LQLSAVESGAACLAMVLGYYGRQMRVSECREELGIGRDGATALMIAKAARAQGLRVKAYSLDVDDMRYIQGPAIVHWNFNHFVVERWSPRHVDIIDPAVGRRRLLPKAFEASFTGVALTLCLCGYHKIHWQQSSVTIAHCRAFLLLQECDQISAPMQ
jgi:ABC-type bacteriocin/lantibiotic exporter with double-glycine peptidase domain